MFKIISKQNKVENVITMLVIILASLLVISSIISHLSSTLSQDFIYFQFFTTVATIFLVQYVYPVYYVLIELKDAQKGREKKNIVILLCISFVLFLAIVILSYMFLFLHRNYIYIIITFSIIHRSLSYFVNKLIY